MRAYLLPLIALGFLGLSTTVVGAAGDAVVFVVQPHPVARTFPAESVVEAVQQTVVGAQLPGRIVEVRADAGQAVRKGDVLMRIDAREAAEVVRAAEAQYANAKATHERTKRLVDQKFMSAAALDKAKADLDAAAAARGAAGAGQSHATIVAPIGGVIARRQAELGDMAMPGTPLYTIYQPGSLRVTASVPQYRLQDMRGAKAARVEFPELGKRIDATAVQVLPGADAATHTSTVRVALPAMAEAVVPGMFARVHFVTGEAVLMTVPANAVVRRGEVAAVYVQNADGRVLLRQLRLGNTVGDGEIEVLAGLTAGEKVLADPVRAAIDLKKAAAAAAK